MNKCIQIKGISNILTTSTLPLPQPASTTTMTTVATRVFLGKDQQATPASKIYPHQPLKLAHTSRTLNFNLPRRKVNARGREDSLELTIITRRQIYRSWLLGTTRRWVSESGIVVTFSSPGFRHTRKGAVINNQDTSDITANPLFSTHLIVFTEEGFLGALYDFVNSLVH